MKDQNTKKTVNQPFKTREVLTVCVNDERGSPLLESVSGKT